MIGKIKDKLFPHKHDFIPVRMMEDGFVLSRCDCGERNTDIPFTGTKYMLKEEEKIAKGEKSIR